MKTCYLSNDQGGITMKKKLISIALSLAMTAPLAAVSTASALDPPKYGDVNWDWQLSIADLVCMKNYLLGNYEMNANQLFYNDLNKDGSVDVFDYILLEKLITSETGQVQKTFTRCAASMVDSTQYSKHYDGEAVIHSVDELREYFQPTSVISTSGECYIFEVASQEVIDDFLERYDDKFFAWNVLLLKYLGGVDQYTYKSVQYEGDDLVIEYYDSSDPNLTYFNPLPPYIAEVAVPKGLRMDGDIIWKEVDRPLKTTVKTDATNAVETEAISWAISDNDPVVIKSAEEFDEFVSDKFKSGVVKSLKNTYNDAYFENNVLVLDIFQHGYRDDYEVSVTVEKSEHGDTVLKYDRAFINGFVDKQTVITQVTIPKTQYYDMSFKREKSWEQRTSVDYTEYDIHSMPSDEELVKNYSKEGQWITSAEEMDEYLADCFTEKGLEMFGSAASNIDWNSKAAYVWLDSDIIGSTHKLASSAQNDDEITLNFANRQPLSCEGGSFLRILEVNKWHAGKKITERNFNVEDSYPSTDGERLLLEFSPNDDRGYYDYTPILINQYSFGGVDTADVYKLRTGGGAVQFNGYELIGTIELENGYMPFSEDSSPEYTETENGRTVCAADNFRAEITRNGDEKKLTISYTVDKTEKTCEFNF